MSSVDENIAILIEQTKARLLELENQQAEELNKPRVGKCYKHNTAPNSYLFITGLLGTALQTTKLVQTTTSTFISVDERIFSLDDYTETTPDEVLTQWELMLAIAKKHRETLLRGTEKFQTATQTLMNNSGRGR